MGYFKIISILLGICAFSFKISYAQNINYFGVAFSPYVKPAPFPNWDTYTLTEIKQMLKIILTKHNSVSTYGMGVDGKIHNN
jgi:hypothetical protein